jgi:hypothetical protein
MSNMHIKMSMGMDSMLTGNCWEELYPDGVCQPSELIQSVLDQQMAGLPRKAVSDHETRYPIDEPSMRAFLETFFTRHLFQLQRSLVEYATSLDFQRTVQFGPLRILDIGSGPAVASLGAIDLVRRAMQSAIGPRAVRMIHVLNDTSPICLATGKRMLAACHELEKGAGLVLPSDRVFTLPTAFPRNMHKIQQLASFLGGYDIIILSYVMDPLTDDYGLRVLVAAVRALERLCRPHGRILLMQDRFREALIRSLTQMLSVEYQEQMVTQEIYPPRGDNETYTYTYYDCLYAPRRTSAAQLFSVA